MAQVFAEAISVRHFFVHAATPNGAQQASGPGHFRLGDFSPVDDATLPKIEKAVNKHFIQCQSLPASNDEHDVAHYQ